MITFTIIIIVFIYVGLTELYQIYKYSRWLSILMSRSPKATDQIDNTDGIHGLTKLDKIMNNLKQINTIVIISYPFLNNNEKND